MSQRQSQMLVNIKNLDVYQVSVHSGESLLDLALRNHWPINHSCGGNASCGTCLVTVLSKKGNLCQRNELEQEMAQDRGFSSSERLACQLTMEGLEELEIEVSSLK